MSKQNVAYFYDLPNGKYTVVVAPQQLSQGSIASLETLDELGYEEGLQSHGSWPTAT